MSQPNINKDTLLLKPYETRNVAVTGAGFLCKSATTGFKLSVNGGQRNDWDGGFWFKVAEDDAFRFLEFQNPTAEILQIEYFTFSELVNYSPTTNTLLLKNAPTVNKGNDPFTLAAAGTQDFDGTANGATPRKSIIVHNQEDVDSGNVLQILDADGKAIDILAPGQDWGLDTSDTITVKNPNAGAVTFTVGEVYYAS